MNTEHRHETKVWICGHTDMCRCGLWPAVSRVLVIHPGPCADCLARLEQRHMEDTARLLGV